VTQSGTPKKNTFLMITLKYVLDSRIPHSTETHCNKRLVVSQLLNATHSLGLISLKDHFGLRARVYLAGVNIEVCAAL
jgi:hypothetical protein